MDIPSPLYYAKRACDTILNQYSPSELPPSGRFRYHQGVFLTAVEQLSDILKNDTYLEYIKSWINCYVADDGEISQCDPQQFDDIHACILLFRLYSETKKEKYKLALDRYIGLFHTWPKTSEGGFWHKKTTPNQMWLDGLYMAGTLAVRYGTAFNAPEYIEMAYTQMTVMKKHTRHPSTGLLVHAWDESKKEDWADSVTGASSCVWGRSVGWFIISCLYMYSLLPDGHKYKNDFSDTALDLICKLIKYQDDSGFWYQLTNLPDMADNWRETSSTCLFAFAIAYAVNAGLLDKSYAKYAKKAYNGIITEAVCDDKSFTVGGVCVGTNVGDCQYYLTRKMRENDLHGMAAFIFMCTEISKL